MDKEKALQAIQSFQEHALNGFYNPSVPVTQQDLKDLISKISILARELVNSISQ